MNYEDERRAIELTDAAGRALNNGMPELAEQLSKQAKNLFRAGDEASSSSISVTVAAEINPSQVAFDAWAKGQGLNVEQHRGEYVSSGTRERWWCWQAACETQSAIQA
ncbi:hypothetical protein [Pseudomonas sp. WS 5410]|uniref:hypothetical protein n=1 Tax=Pseudomonas sp. WS 5410 TaxID=2717485 RepID=UPI001472F7A8|nr:hypothetical protein [Pseudomonas sp. WS 5410]NMY20815.1 hypothetical protein [Pseudomonas sp. WS 5410]